MNSRIKKTIPFICAVALALGCTVTGVMHRITYPKAPVPQQGKKTVICIGDSITYGDGVRFKRKTESYPACLQALLGDEYQVLNYGLNGRTLLSEGDMPYTEEKFYGLSLQVPADVVIIMLGTNDSKPQNWNNENYLTELKQFTEAYMQTDPGAKVFLMQPSRCFPVGDEEIKYDISNDIIAGDVYKDVAEAAQSLDAGLIDLYTFTEGHPEWFDDGIHPNAAGNRAIAEYICGRLKECGIS